MSNLGMFAGSKPGKFETFGLRIQWVRLGMGMTMQDFGEMCGLDKKTAKTKISQYEHGIHQAKYDFILGIAKATGVPEYYFYIQDDDLAESLLLAIHEGKDWIVKL